MKTPERLPLASLGPLREDAPNDLVALLLEEQQSLTAVERFSLRHDEAGDASFRIENKSFYRDLIPLREPGPREQYAFEVDLDRCTGCKACVTACHNLNGLDEGETWRSVGVLQRVSAYSALSQHAAPGARIAQATQTAQQHVTTACHHCADPACVQGCPTLAYEKDPATGVVRHLDDQCFGCQYCILKCPYDVPQYNAKRGIVRKCDLCIGRLREGEAPACAQACPTQAIRVALVETESVRRAPAAAFDLPDVPDPVRVHPTTHYISRRGLPPGMEAADAAQVRAESAHHPLTAMLVASQAAAGYWIILALTALSNVFQALTSSRGLPPAAPSPWLEIIGALGVQGALGLSLLHLGRPWLAWKAMLGWRRSWLSREVIAFSAFAGTTGLYAGIRLVEWHAGGELPALGGKGPGAAVALCVFITALAALYASAMVYRDTPRALWAARETLWRFVLTAALCGIPAWLCATQAAASGWLPFASTGMDTSPGGIFPGGAVSTFPARALLLALPFVTVVKLMLESAVLRRRDDGAGPLWKAAQLLLGPLRPLRAVRLALGLVGGGLLPVLIAAGASFAKTAGLGPLALPGAAFPWTALALLLITGGELLERHLFFVTAVAPRMPGGRA